MQFLHMRGFEVGFLNIRQEYPEASRISYLEFRNDNTNSLEACGNKSMNDVHVKKKRPTLKQRD